MFNSQPARIGFIVAMALKIIGRPGINKNVEDQETNLKQIEENFKILETKLKAKASEELQDFLSFDVLNELLDKPSAKVGDFERSFFKEAFIALIDLSFDVPSFDVCWRAY